MVALGASVAGALGVQDTALSPLIGSVTPTLCSVSVPVFFALNVYVTTVPATAPVLGAALFVSEMVPV